MSAGEELAPWMEHAAEPTAATPPRPASIDAMTLAEVRASWFDLHHRLNVATLETNALRQSCEVFERAHNIAVEQLVAKRDEAGALREAVGLAEKVIADLRRQIEELTCDLDGSTDGYRARIRDLQRERSALQGRVVELERLAAGPRVVPTLCRDCGGDGVANGTDCGACAGEGCRS